MGGGGQQPQVPGGVRGEGQPEGAVLQGADQDAYRQAEAGRGQGRVCGEVCAEAAARGGQAGGRARQGDGEVQGHHRGARAYLRRDVRLLRLVSTYLSMDTRLAEAKKLSGVLSNLLAIDSF